MDDDVLLMDVIIEPPGAPGIKLASSCVGGVCTFTLGDSVLLEIPAVLIASLKETPDFEVFERLTAGGIAVEGFHASVVVEGDLVDMTGYGAWIDGRMFFSAGEFLFPESIEIDGAYGIYALSFGEATGSTFPIQGGAIWTGAIIGVGHGLLGEYVIGTATLDIDSFANPDVDVAFTDIAGAAYEYTDMHW